ncbi:GAF domain-containing protein [Neobacillus sp. SM06]|uniref:GAF domain-containing protein n=1 Tax=Neobacillus sp. SM06 TaxID=3422492 RepID=UPI003D283EFC
MGKITLKDLLTLKLNSVVAGIKADFSALAFYDPINMEFRWKLAIGSLNNRYIGIVVRSGKGICGRVLKTKREFLITEFPEELEDEFLEFPILIAEELKSAVAVPLFFQTQLIGVLLIGQRTKRKFSNEEINYLKKLSDEIVLSYTQGRKGEPQNDEKKEIKKAFLSQYFVQKKLIWGDKLDIILLDQRITLLSENAQQKLISIFDFLLDHAFIQKSQQKVNVLIELRSEHQFSVQIETEKQMKLSEKAFSRLADEVRMLNGNIDINFKNEKTILTMNFFLSLLIEDEL